MYRYPGSNTTKTSLARTPQHYKITRVYDYNSVSVATFSMDILLTSPCLSSPRQRRTSLSFGLCRASHTPPSRRTSHNRCSGTSGQPEAVVTVRYAHLQAGVVKIVTSQHCYSCNTVNFYSLEEEVAVLIYMQS